MLGHHERLGSITSSFGKWYLKFILLRWQIMETTDCIMPSLSQV